jgi:hypothetical protein
VRILNYEIREWTDSTKTVLSLWERGIGSYNTSTEVLTRSKVLYTWSGSAYLPKFGTATAPTAISFGSTAANIDIMFNLLVGQPLGGLPFVYGTVASVADGLGVPQISVATSSSATLSPSTGVVYYTPIYLQTLGPLSQASIRVTTGATAAGGTPSTLSVAIYEIATDGTPGKKLVDFGSLGRPTTSNATITNSAIATPIYIYPGWYWMAVLYVAGTDTGGCTIRGLNTLVGGPQGGLFADGWVSSHLTVSGQTALNDPATAPTAHANSQYTPFVFFK